jgi:hypothetical protein
MLSEKEPDALCDWLGDSDSVRLRVTDPDGDAATLSDAKPSEGLRLALLDPVRLRDADAVANSEAEADGGTLTVYDADVESLTLFVPVKQPG